MGHIRVREKSSSKTIPLSSSSSFFHRFQHHVLDLFTEYGLLGEEEEEQGVYTEEMRAVFLFGRPELYYDIIDLMLIIISFYLAIWVVNFTYSANQLEQPAVYRFLSLLPGLLSGVLLVYNVRSSYLLKVILIKYAANPFCSLN